MEVVMNLHKAVRRCIFAAAMTTFCATYATGTFARTRATDITSATVLNVFCPAFCASSGTPGDPFVHDQLPIHILFTVVCLESTAVDRMDLLAITGDHDTYFGTPGDINPHVLSTPGDGLVHDGPPG